MKQKTRGKQTNSKELRAERKLLTAQYGDKEARLYRRLLRKIRIEKPRFWWQERSIWQKIGVVLATVLIFFGGSAYGIARWYIASQSHKDFKFGATFIPGYARYFDLNPQDTLQAMIDDLNIRHFRLVSYWEDIEKTPGQYDFSELDWQFQKIEAAGGTVSLSIGLRQPRWPECHMPDWTKHQPKDFWYPRLKNVMQAVMERYKTHPALISWQLENEYFLSVFGECPDFSRERLVEEFDFAKGIDSTRPIILSRSNNIWGIPVGQPRADQVGISIYKRVWDRTVTKRYFEYPFPAWYYAFFAGATKLVTGRDTMVHELQTEPWGPDKGIKEISIEEQNKSFSAEMMYSRLAFAKATGLREIDLWGVEMWYWRKVNKGDPSLWNAGKEALRDLQCTTCYAPRDN